jgi:transposase InsO family protein
MSRPASTSYHGMDRGPLSGNAASGARDRGKTNLTTFGAQRGALSSQEEQQLYHATPGACHAHPLRGQGLVAADSTDNLPAWTAAAASSYASRRSTDGLYPPTSMRKVEYKIESEHFRYDARGRRRTSGYMSAGPQDSASSDGSDVVVFMDKDVPRRRLYKTHSDEIMAEYPVSDVPSQRPSPLVEDVRGDLQRIETPSPRDQQLVQLGRLQERSDVLHEQVVHQEQKLLGQSMSPRLKVSCSNGSSPGSVNNTRMLLTPPTMAEKLLNLNDSPVGFRPLPFTNQPPPVSRLVEQSAMTKQRSPHGHDLRQQSPPAPRPPSVSYDDVAKMIEHALSAKPVSRPSQRPARQVESSADDGDQSEASRKPAQARQRPNAQVVLSGSTRHREYPAEPHHRPSTHPRVLSDEEVEDTRQGQVRFERRSVGHQQVTRPPPPPHSDRVAWPSRRLNYPEYAEQKMKPAYVTEPQPARCRRHRASDIDIACKRDTSISSDPDDSPVRHRDGRRRDEVRQSKQPATLDEPTQTLQSDRRRAMKAARSDSTQRKNDETPESLEKTVKQKPQQPANAPTCKVVMKPKTFDGKNVNLNTFLMQFENCARFNGWTEIEKAAFLRNCVTAEAGQLLWDDGDSCDASYAELVTCLRRRYAGAGQEERFQAELRSLRRGRGETLQSVYQTVKRLMALAFPAEKSRCGTIIARDAFITALNDTQLERRVREREPADVEAAYTLAVKLESLDRTLEKTDDAVTRQKVTRQVRDNVEDSAIPEVKRQLEQQRQELVKIKNELKSKNERPEASGKTQTCLVEQSKLRNLEAENERLRRDFEQLRARISMTPPSNRAPPRRSAGRTGSPGRPSQPDVQCFNCQGYGHYSRDCSMPKAFNRGQPAAQSGPYRCELCGKPGHYPPNCPNRTQPVETSTIPERGNVMGVTRLLRANNSKEVYLPLKIAGKEELCLLDTGSDVNLLPERLAKGAILQPSSQRLSAANGTNINVLGVLKLYGWTGPRRLEIEGLASDNVDEVILGIEWLKRNGAAWNFQTDELQIDDSVFPLISTPSAQCVKRVVSQTETRIEPWSQADLPAKVVYHNPFVKSADDPTAWTTEPAEPCAGLHVACTIVPNRNQDVPIRVMNLRQYSITVPAGTVLSELAPLEGCQPFDDPTAGTAVPDVSNLQRLVEDADSSLSETQSERLRTLLEEFQDVFSRSEFDLGSTDAVTHSIDTGLNRPVKQQMHRHPFAYDEAIREQTRQMLDQNIVEPSQGEWRSNVVLVKKKDGSLRFCVDYRRLNDVTRKDVYPLPRIDTCLDALSGARWFSTFDLRSGYHQVRMNDTDKDKTAFVTREGTFRFRVMPFGLCNAGATFQRLMDIIMSGLNFEICLVYLDDIVLFSSSIDQHMERLRLLLARLRAANLKLKPSKCQILRRQVEFLGHVVSGDGIATAPSKIQAVADWPTPTSVKEVRSFVGLASYYRRFVKGFADIAAPLHALTGKNQEFSWNDRCDVAFDTLKRALIETPVLAMPVDGEPYLLDTDASNHGIGAVLSQRQQGVGRPVAYASRTYNKPEKNYCVTRKELLAVVFYLKHFKQYLLGRPFVVRTDHAALQWLRKTPDVIGQQSRWLETMEEFQFTVEHRPGARHQNADALSRRPCIKRGCCRLEEEKSDANDVVDRVRRIGRRKVATRRLRKTTRRPTGSDTYEPEVPDNDRHDVQPEPPSADPAVTAAECDPRGEEIEPSSDDAESTPEDMTVLATGAKHEGPADRSGLMWSWAEIAEAQRDDAEIGVICRLKADCQDQPPWTAVGIHDWRVKAYWTQWIRLQVRGGVLYRRWESEDGLRVVWQVVLPVKYRSDLIRLLHSGMTGGHAGLTKTSEQVKYRAYWVGWTADVRAEVGRCDACAQYHRGSAPRQVGLQPMPVGEPWERLGIDITGPHPRSSRGNEYALTVVDHFTKWAEAYAIPNHQATTVARKLVNELFTRFGTPLQILSDQGTEFGSQLMQEIYKWLDIDKLRTSPYRPQCNGATERLHRTLNQMLAKCIACNQRDWDQRLPFVMAAYRATVHESTGYTPNYLVFGREVYAPLDVVLGVPEGEGGSWESTNDFVAERQRISRESYAFVRKTLMKCAQRRKVYYDIKVKPKIFAVGDWVWYYSPRKYVGRSAKWVKNYTGPFLVVRVIPPTTAVIQKSRRSNVQVVHFDKLKVCRGRTPVSWTLPDAAGPAKGSQSDLSPAPRVVTESHVAEEEEVADTHRASTSLKKPRIRRPSGAQLPSCDDEPTMTARRPQRVRYIPNKLHDFVCAVDMPGGTEKRWDCPCCLSCFTAFRSLKRHLAKYGWTTVCPMLSGVSPSGAMSLLDLRVMDLQELRDSRSNSAASYRYASDAEITQWLTLVPVPSTLTPLARGRVSRKIATYAPWVALDPTFVGGTEEEHTSPNEPLPTGSVRRVRRHKDVDPLAGLIIPDLLFPDDLLEAQFDIVSTAQPGSSYVVGVTEASFGFGGTIRTSGSTIERDLNTSSIEASHADRPAVLATTTAAGVTTTSRLDSLAATDLQAPSAMDLVPEWRCADGSPNWRRLEADAARVAHAVAMLPGSLELDDLKYRTTAEVPHLPFELRQFAILVAAFTRTEEANRALAALHTAKNSVVSRRVHQTVEAGIIETSLGLTCKSGQSFSHRDPAIALPSTHKTAPALLIRSSESSETMSSSGCDDEDMAVSRPLSPTDAAPATQAMPILSIPETPEPSGLDVGSGCPIESVHLLPETQAEIAVLSASELFQLAGQPEIEDAVVGLTAGPGPDKAGTSHVEVKVAGDNATRGELQKLDSSRDDVSVGATRLSYASVPATITVSSEPPTTLAHLDVGAVGPASAQSPVGEINALLAERADLIERVRVLEARSTSKMDMSAATRPRIELPHKRMGDQYIPTASPVAAPQRKAREGTQEITVIPEIDIHASKQDVALVTGDIRDRSENRSTPSSARRLVTCETVTRTDIDQRERRGVSPYPPSRRPRVGGDERYRSDRPPSDKKSRSDNDDRRDRGHRSYATQDHRAAHRH